MKILLVTGAIYAQNSSRKHFTGLDYVVTQIGQSLSNDNEIVFFTTSPIGEKSVVDGKQTSLLHSHYQLITSSIS